MIGYLRARGLFWSAPLALLAVLGAAWFAWWLESRPNFGHWDRVPAIVLGALGAAIFVTAGLHRIEDEIDGSTPRPRPMVELVTTAGLVAVIGAVAVLAIPDQPWQRGGAELTRDILGLTGLALLGGSLAGARLAWLLPFGWTSISYFGVTRDYDRNPEQAALGWLMFPADFAVTWCVAAALLVSGFGAFAWGGFVPLPRRHPRR